MKRPLSIGIILLFIGMSISSSTGFDVEQSSTTLSNGKTLYVGGSGPGNYTRIQGAIDNASGGDTVFVYSGIYYEHIIIWKKLSLIGENLTETIIDGYLVYNLIDIYSSFVTIKNFTLKNCKYSAIIVFNSNLHRKEIHISNCNIIDCSHGFYFDNVNNSSISNCSISNINCSGIRILSPSNNMSINHCFINNCDNFGISLKGSNISIENCYITNNTYRGISVDRGSKDCSFSNNTITNNAGGGIIIYDSISNNNTYNISIKFNQIINNGDGTSYDAGIFVQDCFQSLIIEGNSIIHNDYDGIYLLKSSEILINQNEISQNKRYGLFLEYASSRNLIYKNNFINNKLNAFFLNSNCNNWSENYWNRPRILPKPIFGALSIFPWINIDWHPASEPYDIEV